LDFIDRNAEQPFFVYYNPILAHDPWTTTPDSLDAETPKEKFSGMMTYLDKMVGRVLAKLDEHGLTENTLIWFIGDNGTHPQITSTRNGKPITGGKWNTKTAGTHVPYIMQWKEEMPAGIVKNGLVELLDVYTTLQSAVGHPNETELDGVDLIPYVKGEANHTRDSVFMHYDPQWGADYFNTPMPAARFIFNDSWKLYGDGRFYHTKEDPLEETNLARADLAQEAAMARQSLKEAFDSMKDGPLKSPYLNSGIEAKAVPPPDPSCEE
jgi:arylsulfatase A-like enzyme